MDFFSSMQLNGSVGALETRREQAVAVFGQRDQPAGSPGASQSWVKQRMTANLSRLLWGMNNPRKLGFPTNNFLKNHTF